jgi:hypothetical protein
MSEQCKLPAQDLVLAAVRDSAGTHTPLLLRGSEYFDHVVAGIGRTVRGERIALATMTFDPASEAVSAVIDALAEAAGRGVDVNLCVDAHAFLLLGGSHYRTGPLLFRKALPAHVRGPFRHRLDALHSLARCGARYVICNLPQRRLALPYAGRSHIKGTVINDTVYVGGKNLSSPEDVDLVACWQDARAADWLYDFVRGVITSGSAMLALRGIDQTIRLDRCRVLVADAGVQNRSHIRDLALRMVDEAQEWATLTCQYFPGGDIGGRLADAHRRGVAVDVRFSPPTVHGAEAVFHRMYIARHRRRLPPRLFEGRLPQESPRLHAKLLATEKGCLLGSHNLVDQGVKLGTAEIAVQFQDPEVSRRAVLAIEDQMGRLHG